MRKVLQFGPFEADLEARTVRRNGKVIALTPREFATLRLLLENSGQIVSKKTFIDSIWKGEFVSEGNLSQQIKNLRDKLEPEGDSLIRTFARQGYSIETVSAIPAQPLEPSVPEPPAEVVITSVDLSRIWALAVLGCFSLILFGLVVYLAIRSRNVRILQQQQLTQDGRPKRGPILFGKGEIWFEELIDGEWRVVRVPADGGSAIPVNIPINKVVLLDITGDGSTLLCGSEDRRSQHTWAWSISSNNLELIREQYGSSTLSSDRTKLAVAEDGRLLVLRKNAVLGFSAFPAPRAVDNPRWAPDGGNITFDLGDLKTASNLLWQADALGENPQPIRSTAHSGEIQMRSRWTKDGQYLLYEAGTRQSQDHDVWAVPNPNSVVGRFARPARLTTGDLNWTWPAPGAMRGNIFAFGEMVKPELVRFDLKSSYWTLYLNGVAAYDLDFSRDGKQVTFTKYPDHTIWRANLDGSAQTQLTSFGEEARQPHWSPDGREIAFMARTSSSPWKVFIIPAAGGKQVSLSPYAHDIADEGVPTWSKDGRFIVYGEWLYSKSAPMRIHLFDRLKSQFTLLDGSDNLWTSRWSPDGLYISALRSDWSALMIKGPGLTGPWRQLASGHVIDNTVWSQDSKYIYYTDRDEASRLCQFRVSVPDGAIEARVGLDGFPMPSDSWFGVAPDGSPLGLRAGLRRELYRIEAALP